MEIQNTKDQLFRYRRANEFSLDELENNYIYFPPSKELNDQFDASHVMLNLTQEDSEMQKLFIQMLELTSDKLSRDYIKRNFENNPEQLRKIVTDNISEFISTYGIACFTVTPVHITLWAYYANHEGICIQYDTIRDESFFQGARRVDYVNQLEKINYEPITNPSAMNSLFYKKLNLWDKEFEIRLVKPKTGKHQFNPECVRSIILGLNAKDEFIEKVVDIVRRKYKHVTLYQAEIMTESVGFSFIPFNL